jgi:hypothetical protein
MHALTRFPIEGGGWVLVEADPSTNRGPVQAGRMREVVTDASDTLQTALSSVTDASRVILDQLRDVRPAELEVEFGVELTAATGAVIAKVGSNCHLTVKLTWRHDDDAESGSVPGRRL